MDSEVSLEEREQLIAVFYPRNFSLKEDMPIDNSTNLYLALPQEIQEAIPQAAFEKAFASLKEETREAFFKSIRGKTEFSYLDLPLRAALIINGQLQKDPWKQPRL